MYQIGSIFLLFIFNIKKKIIIMIIMIIITIITIIIIKPYFRPPYVAPQSA